MEEQKSHIIFNGVEYGVVLDKNGMVWFINPSNPESKYSSIGSGMIIKSIKEAEECVIEMLKSRSQKMKRINLQFSSFIKQCKFV